MKITKDCTIKAKILDINQENLLQDLIDYYKQNDEYTYLSLRKEQLDGKTKNFERVMENGGSENIKTKIHQLLNTEETFQVYVEYINDNSISIPDALNLGDDDGGYDYNEDLDLYVSMESRMCSNPDGYGVTNVIWFTYLSVLTECFN